MRLPQVPQQVDIILKWRRALSLAAKAADSQLQQQILLSSLMQKIMEFFHYTFFKVFKMMYLTDDTAFPKKLSYTSAYTEAPHVEKVAWGSRFTKDVRSLIQKFNFQFMIRIIRTNWYQKNWYQKLDDTPRF